MSYEDYLADEQQLSNPETSKKHGSEPNDMNVNLTKRAKKVTSKYFSKSELHIFQE